MKTNKYIYHSQFNNGTIIGFPFTTVFMIWLFYKGQIGVNIWLLCLIATLFNYLIFAFQSRWYFYDDHIVRIFVFRPFFRKRVFKYEQLYKIRYVHDGNRDCPARFIVFQKKKRHFKDFNRFVFNKRAGRFQIIEFLLSKNVKIEVTTHFENMDKSIIDIVKKKYPKNIRLDPMLPKGYQQWILMWLFQTVFNM